MRRGAKDPRKDPVTQSRIGRCTWSKVARARRDARLSATEANLYAELCGRTVLGYGDGRVGVKRLAAAVHRTPRTVRRCLANLEALGYVDVEERRERHGGPAVNTYRAVTPKDWSAVETERRRAARRARDAARKRRGGVLTRVAPALTRGRVNVLHRTGRGNRGRPAVPAGGRTMRVEEWPEWLTAGFRRCWGNVDPGRGPEAARNAEVGAQIVAFVGEGIGTETVGWALDQWEADRDKREIGR